MRWRRGNRLKLVSEAKAPPRTSEIFDEVRHSLGVPVVPLLYRAYATYPEFLEVHWQTFRPAVQSRQFFSLSARLAAESYTRVHNYFNVDNVAAGEATGNGSAAISLSQALDYYQYLDPLLLLIASAQMQAFEGPVGDEHIAPESVQPSTFAASPRLLEDYEASPPIHRIWEERRRLLELAFVSDEHRAMARWSGFYQAYGRALQEWMRSPLFSDCQHRIGESASGLARELPAKLETGVQQLLDAGLGDEEAASIVHINEALGHAYSGLILDITFARVACEGGTRREGQPRPAAAAEVKAKPADPTTHAA